MAKQNCGKFTQYFATQAAGSHECAALMGSGVRRTPVPTSPTLSQGIAACTGGGWLLAGLSALQATIDSFCLNVQRVLRSLVPSIVDKGIILAKEAL